MNSLVLQILRGVGLLTGAAVHVVPLVTIRKVVAARSTLNYHVASYGFSLLNQTTNLWYAIVRKDAALIIHRSISVILHTFYVCVFLKYCPIEKYAEFKTTLLRLLLVALFFACDLHILLPIFTGDTSLYRSHIAFFGAMTGIGATAGPLATVVRG